MWIPALGLIDLVAAWFLDEPTIVHDLGYGALTGIIVPVGFLAQLRAAERAVAGLQQAMAGAVAYTAAGILSGDHGYVVFGALVAAACLSLLALHPMGGLFFTLPEPLGRAFLAVAVAPAIPLVFYALDAAEKQRAGEPPVDFHAGLGSWAGLAAMALGVALVAPLAAAKTRGWRLPAWSAAAALAVFGLASMLFPDRAGSVGRAWGAAAVAWAIAFAAFAERERRAREA